jgi:3-oxoacyl-[acyl-carrier protein] reductase
VHAHRARAEAQTLVEEIRAGGGSAEGVSFDVTDGPLTRRALESLLAAGPIQVW